MSFLLGKTLPLSKVDSMIFLTPNKNDIYLLVLSAEKGFEVGSERVARSRESKRFERRITKGTKYFDEVWKFI